MLAILKRELKSYYHTVIGWLFMAVTLVFISLYFTVYNLYSGYPYIRYVFQSVIFVFFITVPVLTMRILAEDRKNKTDQMIYTAPVSIGKVVLGKYLSMVIVFTIPVLISCIYPLILRHYGDIGAGESYIPILGYYLYGIASIAIGMFISSLTESQVIAAVISALVLFLGYMMDSICNVISRSGNVLTKVLRCFSLTRPFNSMAQGMLDLSAVLYYLTIVFLFCFLTTVSIQKRRWNLNKTNRKLGVFQGSYVAVVIILAVVANLAFGQIPERYTKIDVTKQHFYSITNNTKELLSNLQEDVTLYVLAAEAKQDKTVKQTLGRYASYKHVKVEYKDTDTYPNFASKYTDTSLSENSIIVVCGDKSKAIDYNQLYETQTTSNYETQVTGYDAEGQLTSAIAMVTSDNIPKVYVIEGHDEQGLSDEFSDALSRENVQAENLNLLTCDAIPDDAECVMILGPSTDFNDTETQMLRDYLASGGNAYILPGYPDKSYPNLESVMKDYGIETMKGMVVDTDRNSYTQLPYLLIPTVKSTDMTKEIAGSYVLSAYSTGLKKASDKSDDVTLTTLLTSGDSAICKTDFENMQSYDLEDGDVEGPFLLGVWAKKNVDVQTTATDATESSADSSNTSNMVVFASSIMANKQADSIVSGNNQKLFQAVMSKLVNHTTTISIPVKSYSIDYLTVPMSDVVWKGIVLTIVIPVAMFIAGIVIWIRRRKHA